MIYACPLESASTSRHGQADNPQDARGQQTKKAAIICVFRLQRTFSYLKAKLPRTEHTGCQPALATHQKNFVLQGYSWDSSRIEFYCRLTEIKSRTCGHHLLFLLECGRRRTACCRRLAYCLRSMYVLYIPYLGLLPRTPP